MKQKIINYFNFWYYPTMIVVAFRAYAFESYGMLFIYFAFMTIIAAGSEFQLNMERKRSDILSQGVLVLASKIDTLTGERK